MAGLILLQATAVGGWAQESGDAAPGDEKKEADFAGLKLRGIGPALMSGRVVDVAVDPVKPSTWYVAAASGGVWKTTNAGTTWSPIFDGYRSLLHRLRAVDPPNHLVVWVGTGENNSQRSVGYGDGLYRSIDGGKSFNKVGLEKSEHIAKVVIDPATRRSCTSPRRARSGRRRRSRVVQDRPTAEKPGRPCLTISENTGVTDVVFDPRNPDVSTRRRTSGGGTCGR